jgi:hypothetical protein
VNGINRRFIIKTGKESSLRRDYSVVYITYMVTNGLITVSNSLRVFDYEFRHVFTEDEKKGLSTMVEKMVSDVEERFRVAVEALGFLKEIADKRGASFEAEIKVSEND